MATTTGACTGINAYYATSGGNPWNDGTKFYSGWNGSSIYRSKIAITTPAFTGNCVKLVVAITIDGTSSPRGCYGVLHSDGTIATNKIVSNNIDSNGRYDGPHPDLTSGCIAQSYACSDTSGTVQTGNNQSSGHTFYFIFNTTALKPSTTYYVYAMKYTGWQNSTSTGWTQANESAISATLTYTPTYTISYKPGSYANETSTYTQTKINGTTLTLRATTYTRTGYTQTAWASNAAGSTYAYALSESYTSNSATTLYPYWTANTYKLTFNANGGINTSGGNFALSSPATGYGETESWVTVTYGASTFSSMQNNIPTRSGYKFLGWYTATSGGTQIYTATGVSTNNGTYWSSSGVWNSTSAQTIYAQWQKIESIITLDPNGGSVSSTSITVNYPNGSYSELPIPTWEGRQFQRWYADIGKDGPINLGREYMFTDYIDIRLDAYMDDWSKFSNMRLISCAENGGWNIQLNNGYIQFVMYDAGVGYKYITATTLSTSLPAGWHSFRMLFNGTNMIGYIDGIKQGSLSMSTIGYNSTNVIWIGGEATSSNTKYDTTISPFAGYIGKVSITNVSSDPSTNSFSVPVENITLYADWKTCEYLYIKINNTWKLGKLYTKQNGMWT